MEHIHLLKATQLVEKTMPCVLNKFAVWFVTAFAFLAATLAGAGTGLIIFAFGLKISILAWILSIAGFVACAYLLMKLRGSIFVPLRIGHVRVMLEQMKSQETLDHKFQMEQAKDTVEDYFDYLEALAKLERKIRHVLQAIFSKKLNLQRFTLQNRFLGTLLETSTGILVAFLAEIILAYAIRKAKEDPATASADALTLFAQEIDSFSKPVYLLNVFMYTGWLFFIFVMLFPINWLTGMLPVSFGFWNLVFAMVFAWIVKAVILESIAVAALIPVFFEQIKDKQVDPAITQQLNDLSNDFVELKSDSLL